MTRRKCPFSAAVLQSHLVKRRNFKIWASQSITCYLLITESDLRSSVSRLYWGASSLARSLGGHKTTAVDACMICIEYLYSPNKYGRRINNKNTIKTTQLQIRQKHLNTCIKEPMELTSSRELIKVLGRVTDSKNTRSRQYNRMRLGM